MVKNLYSALSLALLAIPLISASPAPAAPTPFGCQHAADPHGDMGFCPSVGAAGWCVCSDSSTYGITSGGNPCPYTTPPPTGPTTLQKTNCATTTAGVGTLVSSSSTAAPVPTTATASVEGAPNDDVSCPVRE